MSQHILSRLRALDCCAVSDALDKLKMPGVCSAMPHRSLSKRIAGQVITIKLGTGQPPPGPPIHLGCKAIEGANGDNVIVIEQRTGIDAGCWGGLLSLAAQVRGVAGVIADGPVRDIDEAIANNFPIFCRALTARTARGRIVEQGTNVDIEFYGIPVRPGDYVLADSSAVIFIGKSEIETVLKEAERILAKESIMVKAIISGTPIGQVLGSQYEHLLH